MSELIHSEQTMAIPFTILRRKQVELRTGLARSTIYRRMKAGKFPKPIDLGSSYTIGWIESEINDWIKDQIEASRKCPV